jgi:hypothetical protein
MPEVAVGAGMAAFPQAPPWAECPVSAHGGSEPDWLKRPIAAVTGCRRVMLAGPEPSSRSACQAVHSPPVTNPPHPIRVNRATVLTLWASVVAELCSAHRFLRYATLPSVRSSRRRGPGLGRVARGGGGTAPVPDPNSAQRHRRTRASRLSATAAPTKAPSRSLGQVCAYCREGSREPDLGLFPGQGEVGVRLGVELGQVAIHRLVWSAFGTAQVL